MSKKDRNKDKNRNQNPVDEQVSESTEPIPVEPKAEEQAPGKNFAEAAERIEAAGGEPVAPIEAVTTNKRGVIPDQFGNNVKGERICSVCGIKESETLAKNPRYSFCKGKCVNCYGKTERKTVKPGDLTIPQLEEKIAYYKDLLQKKLSGAQGLPERNAIENPNEVTSGDTTETHGASVVPTSNATDELATISQ